MPNITKAEAETNFADEFTRWLASFDPNLDRDQIAVETGDAIARNMGGGVAVWSTEALSKALADAQDHYASRHRSPWNLSERPKPRRVAPPPKPSNGLESLMKRW